MKNRLCVLLTIALCFILSSCGSNSSTVEEVKDICVECNGMSEIMCATCNGNGKVECPEEDCDEGITGIGCTNCGGREGVDVCTRCDGEGKEETLCDVCDGDGIIRNPITWEDFYCGNCNTTGRLIVNCSRCGGHGLICNYCKANLSTYPHPEYYPHYWYCETCNGDGIIECGTCKGIKNIPCSICAPEEYQKVLESIQEQNNEEEQEELIEEVITLLSGITSDEPTYRAKPIDKAILQQAKDILNGYEAEFEEKAELLKKINTLEPYFDSKWEYVSGDAKFFLSKMVKNPEYYKFGEIKFSRDNNDFYFRMELVIESSELDGGIFYLKTDLPYIFEYEWYGEEYKVYLTEQNTLLFESYEDDEVINSCEIRRIEE